ncbi:MAG: UDP-N-acetylglucosamine--N-acetylmuramyl-(pentapeptide) pyrophosphoryl-undecaprenol N-acetylglucosamine transferase [Anaerolineales bacterium]
MRLLICAGGTGGGVYPALAVLQALGQRDQDKSGGDDEFVVLSKTQIQTPSDQQFLWIGGIGGMEIDLVKREGIPFEPIPAAGLHGVGLRSVPGNLVQLWRGYKASRRIIRRYKPDVMFFTGGYVAVPVALAGRVPMPGMRRPRSLLYVPDIEPGLALKTLSRIADCIAVSVDDSKAYLPANADVVVSGYPTRSSLKQWNTDEAREVMGLSPEYPTLLVLGGSRGARSINQALINVLPEFLSAMQVIHVSGQLDWTEVEQARADLMNRLGPDRAGRYRPFPYLHEELGAALTIADLVLSRAGASTLGEYPLFGLPAILVPYPYAWRYQQVNAKYLESRGAALIIQDDELPDRLLPEVRRLMIDRRELEKMRSAMGAMATPQAASVIASQISNLAPRSRR